MDCFRACRSISCEGLFCRTGLRCGVRGFARNDTYKGFVWVGDWFIRALYVQFRAFESEALCIRAKQNMAYRLALNHLQMYPSKPLNFTLNYKHPHTMSLTRMYWGFFEVTSCFSNTSSFLGPSNIGRAWKCGADLNPKS